ncbi:MAG: tRNA(5-methylaminomethyl-2-thiouridylate) methyltransferase [Desulfovibrionaceae bacterium]|nr:tRNA(5-methylaminomethyl-2-thiouridylate) methyltransferase [Desulfovibrionaceae bacterium]
MKRYDALSLFSGGLDSVLAARTLMDQGLSVLCLHFVSPFFGKPGRLVHWRETFGLDISALDVGQDYVRMLADGPAHGLGKFLNPCIDCKIFMLDRAVALLPEYGAAFVATGEVVGQRPMSQRLDALHVIRRDSAARNLLLRPLCAKRLPETPMEQRGLVDRERLHAMSGRSRKEQLALAERMGLPEIPTPAGGCMLTEMESVRRYYPVFVHHPAPGAGDFELANIGRQYWSGNLWLSIGRNQSDNARLEAALAGNDMVFKVRDHPGPLALARRLPGAVWDEAVVRDAAAFVASFSPKARQAGKETAVSVGGAAASPVWAVPARDTPLSWHEPAWDEACGDKAALFAARRRNRELGLA